MTLLSRFGSRKLEHGSCFHVDPTPHPLALSSYFNLMAMACKPLLLSRARVLFISRLP